MRKKQKQQKQKKIMWNLSFFSSLFQQAAISARERHFPDKVRPLLSFKREKPAPARDSSRVSEQSENLS